MPSLLRWSRRGSSNNRRDRTRILQHHWDEQMADLAQGFLQHKHSQQVSDDADLQSSGSSIPSPSVASASAAAAASRASLSESPLCGDSASPSIRVASQDSPPTGASPAAAPPAFPAPPSSVGGDTSIPPTGSGDATEDPPLTAFPVLVIRLYSAYIR